MSKIVIIGIDGLDPILLDKWKKELPNIGSMFKGVDEIIAESTFPPDSICAWASIYTGKDPSEHGLLESIDYLSDRKLEDDEARRSMFKGNSFWDIAGRNGKTVCVINPFIAYPAWEVNGIMVSGPVFEGGEISAYPEDILERYPFPPIGGIVDFPDEKELPVFLENTRSTTEELADVSLRIYKDLRPDVFFLSFLTLDRIKHFLWRFTDEEDEYYPGETALKDSIKEFYLVFDAVIGRFRENLEDGTSFILVSDHGHRRRCTKCLNLNEVLRKKGYLKVGGGGARGAIGGIVERAKVFTIAALSRMGLQDWIYRIAKLVPNRKALKKSTYLFDKEGSAVTLSNLCGTNPFGGIDIKADSPGEYNELRERIISELKNLNNELGVNVFKWIKKREEMYGGEHLERIPDIIFELEDEYGVGMDFFTPYITPNYTHRKISGGHKFEAVLLTDINNGKINNTKRPASIVGISNYILDIISRI